MEMPLVSVCQPQTSHSGAKLIEVEYSNNVWIDHVDVSSDRDHDKDYYDGLLDVSP